MFQGTTVQEETVALVGEKHPSKVRDQLRKH